MSKECFECGQIVGFYKKKKPRISCENDKLFTFYYDDTLMFRLTRENQLSVVDGTLRHY